MTAADEEALAAAIATVRRLVPDARSGLPLDVFYLVSGLTPLTNVDLLIQDDAGRTLLTWRDDAFYRGWHVPGGIIRFKEYARDRIDRVAELELGARVTTDGVVIATHELMAADRDVRGHFISFLYRCALASAPDPARRCADLAAPRDGEWAWHAGAPPDLLRQHEMYRVHMEALRV